MSPSSDADRYLNAQPKIKLACQRCGAKGLISLPQLERVLFCNACRVCYRVEAAGLVEVLPSKDEVIKVAVRTNSSQWREHRAVLRERPKLRKRLQTAAQDFLFAGWGRWVVVVGLAVILLTACFTGATAPASSAAATLPTSLEDRAALWATALNSRDMATLTGLTDPSLHRALRIWVAHGSGLPASADAETLAKAPVVLKIVAHPSDVTRASVSAKLPQAAGQTLTVQAEWVQIGEAWYFRPPKLRSVMPAVKRR